MAKWIRVHPLQENDGGAYMCSACRTGDWDIQGTEEKCPYCGADMREVEDDAGNIRKSK